MNVGDKFATVPRLMIAGTSSGVGKTSLTLGLMKAYRDRGLKVQAFKVGPDYLDPLHHSRITGRVSRNLDSWMAEDHLEEILQHGSETADLILVEGVMGVFDGMSGSSDLASSAAVAKRLKMPVLLVADAKAQARSFAAVVYGFANFDKELPLAGVIANRVSGASHFEYLQDAIQAEDLPPLLGYLPPDKNIEIPDRHLGLISPLAGEFEKIYEGLGQWVSEHLDLDRILEIASTAEVLPEVKADLFALLPEDKKIVCRVAIAKDEAFHFYYQDNLDILKALGAEIVEFSPLHDKKVPEADLLIIGGGYPEVHAEALSKNALMLESVRKFAATKTIFAECGGMMLLCKEIKNLEGQVFAMAGVFEESVQMTPRRKALGYVEITTLLEGPLGKVGSKVRGHEFHYSELAERLNTAAAYKLRRPVKKTEKEDGLVRGTNVYCGYAHLHFASNPTMAKALLTHAITNKQQEQKT